MIAPVTRRIDSFIKRPPTVAITVDGRIVKAPPGESLAVALFAAGIRELRRSPRTGGARGMFCLMGVCQECVVTVDGRRTTACNLAVRDGMVVATGTVETGHGG